jgi:Putative restriction endonuclease
MTAIFLANQTLTPEIVYPSSDGEPLAESYDHRKDDVEKKNLYESLGVSEYWQFDPRGEWIPEKLRGYRLQGDLEQIYIQ